MNVLDRKSWFSDLETKADMNSCAIGIIGEIMGSINTTAEKKVVEIACTLRDLQLAWKMKKLSAPTESIKEDDRPNCTIDVSKVESLMDRRMAEEVLKGEGETA